METDKVLALAKQAGGWKFGVTGKAWEFTQDELIRFAALIQQQMIADGWRSPERKVMTDEQAAATDPYDCSIQERK